MFEALGEFLMVYGSTLYKDQFGFDFEFMLAFLMGIIMCNNPSNSNLNPMVTLSFCLRNTRRYQLQLMWIYFKAQFCGAFIAVVLTYLLNGVYRYPFAPIENSYYYYFQISLSECVGVFILCLTVLQIVGPNTVFTTNRLSKFLYIGLMIHLGRRFAVTSFTALNAWITLSRAIIGVWNNDWVGLKYFHFWVIGDVVGCVLSCIFYNITLEPCIIHTRVKDMIVNERYIELKEMEKTHPKSVVELITEPAELEDHPTPEPAAKIVQ
jgi:glycerol uptake facilitator-like aquaporin